MNKISVHGPVVELDGDMHNDTLTRRFGSLSITSTLIAPNGTTLEQTCIEAVENGIITKDLALAAWSQYIEQARTTSTPKNFSTNLPTVSAKRSVLNKLPDGNDRRVTQP